MVKSTQYRYEKASKILETEKQKLFKKQDYDTWEIQDPALIKEVYKVRGNYEEAKKFMLPEKTETVQELLDESQYFKQQLFNEIRRIVMLDYLSSRENFLDVGEQYTSHLAQNVKEWHKFVQYYSDINNARKTKDEQFKRDQFIGEELDWKMLADNLSLFQSQMGDIQEMQGFDPNQSLALDQSIMRHDSMSTPRDDPFQSDLNDIKRTQTITNDGTSKDLMGQPEQLMHEPGETGSDHHNDEPNELTKSPAQIED